MIKFWHFTYLNDISSETTETNVMKLGIIVFRTSLTDLMFHIFDLTKNMAAVTKATFFLFVGLRIRRPYFSRFWNKNKNDFEDFF